MILKKRKETIETKKQKLPEELKEAEVDKK
jgi:hypothetical protein